MHGSPPSERTSAPTSPHECCGIGIHLQARSLIISTHGGEAWSHFTRHASSVGKVCDNAITGYLGQSLCSKSCEDRCAFVLENESAHSTKLGVSRAFGDIEWSFDCHCGENSPIPAWHMTQITIDTIILQSLVSAGDQGVHHTALRRHRPFPLASSISAYSVLHSLGMLCPSERSF